MKKVFAFILIMLLAVQLLTGCSNSPAGQTASQSASAQETATAPQQTEAQPYAFEFEDVDGKVHKLSDYAGKPVYLEVWGSWCSVCMSSLPDLDKFSGEKNDFTVLSVVFPGVAGEMSKEDFISWFKKTDYKNLTVLIDENAQILNDFGITAFPSGIVFDSNGAVVKGFRGLMPEESIKEIMKQVAEGTYEQ